MKFTTASAHALVTGLVMLTGIARADVARHLFLDPGFLDQLEGAALRVNAPERREAVLKPDRPWESKSVGAFVTVREDDPGELRMWYCCRDRDDRIFMAYAESTDGVAWTKPSLGVFDYNGSRDNNILIEQFWEGTPFKDPNAASPDERYVYMGHGHEKGFYRFTSADGIHWKRDPKPLFPFRVDSHDVAFWDRRLGAYALYLRGWDIPGAWNERLRKVVRMQLRTLAEPAPVTPSGKGDNPGRPDDLPRIVDEAETVLRRDPKDPVNTDVYNSAVQPYVLDDRWYVGFPSYFRRSSLVDGRLEVQFVGSADGIHWHRYDHAAYVAPGMAGSNSSNRTYMGVGIVSRGDALWQYGVSYWSQHGELPAKQTEIDEDPKLAEAAMSRADGTVYRYVQRVDGFVSLDFSVDGGTAATVPVKVDGSRLRLNLDTGALGGMRVGLFTSDGNPVAGFGIDDCEPIETNSIRAEVRWRGGASLDGLKGKEVKLKFSGFRTKLYSFIFES